ncbi:PiggyBac transposable element-derived protein 4 [Plakobranchus ocellatus]|uniref:PiggyBac transposable element-derived protein 4 n=1 Tax=Plakobranchus ocellatus TaxID=259542 RepID=A0AAV3YE35_9GAST|nr:PiggyBac transposable element-derived protein 4 [Plakobranchus ocellatus]
MHNSSTPHSHTNTISEPFGICDPGTGFVYNPLIYSGTNTAVKPDLDPDVGRAVKVFERFLGCTGPNYHIYANRIYTSISLIKYLQERQLNYSSTVMTNRKG